MIKVMIVDDTIIYRKILKDVVLTIEDTEVIATAPNGKIALKKIETNKPDLILLDVEMPVMDGLETLIEIKKRYPEIGVIMVSGINERQANITLKALENGAVDFVAKPIGNKLAENVAYLTDNLTPIIKMFQSKKDRKTRITKRIIPHRTAKDVTSKPATPGILNKIRVPVKFDVLVVGVSTGGPNALAEFIPRLPKKLGVPVLLVQHMPPMFTKSLANHLNAKSAIEVVEASDSESILPDKVYIAPGGKHMVLRVDQKTKKPIIGIIDTPPVNSCKPSVDVLFQSISQYYKGNILSLIMTGMGSDGKNGVKKLKRIGCYSVAQSEKSCVVYGMPRAVVDENLADEVVDLKNLASRISELITKVKH